MGEGIPPSWWALCCAWKDAEKGCKNCSARAVPCPIFSPDGSCSKITISTCFQTLSKLLSSSLLSCSKSPGAACISGVSTGLLGGIGAGSALPSGDGERGSVGFEC